MINELCVQLLDELKRANSPVLSLLQTGVPREGIDGKLGTARISITFPEEIYSLYAWRDGINEADSRERALGELTFFTLGIFTSFDCSIDTYREWAIQGRYWPADMFPVFESGGGDYYLVDTNSQSITYRMILFFSPSSPYFQGVVSVFDSLESCLRSIVECYREHAYFYSADSPYLQTNAPEVNEIWKRNNPRSDYFKILESYK